MRKTIKLAAAAAALFAAVPLSAEAMPIAAAPAGAVDAGVTRVAGGCGPGFHRGPMLGCRPNRPLMGPMVRRPVVCRTVILPIPHRVCR